MNITLLGTGACEGIPSLWCDCPLCRHAREHGGKEVRRRTSFLIDRDTMVDFGPDAKSQCEVFRVNTCRLKRILITHSHIDHFRTADMMWRGNCGQNLKLFGNASVLDRLHTAFREAGTDPQAQHMLPVQVRPGEEIRDRTLSILPFRAAHGAPGEIALNYLLTGEHGERVLLLADTGWLPEESLSVLEGRNADAAVIEMSFGIRPPYSNERAYHLGSDAVFELRRELVRRGALKPDAFTAVTHISHCSGVTHSELERFFAGTEIVPGFDGMVIPVGSRKPAVETVKGKANPSFEFAAGIA